MAECSIIIHAIKFILGSGQARAEQSELQAKDCAVLQSSLGMPVAYVVSHDQLGSLQNPEWVHLFEYRGSKTGAELSRTLLRRKRIPFIKTEYSVRGRLIRSVTDLLTRAAHSNERNIYVLGVSDKMFRELWSHTGKLADRKNAGAADGSGQSEPWEIIFDRLKHQFIPRELRDQYVGSSRRAELVRHLIVRASQSDANVLVLGETGTGKEIIARWIHYLGPRKAGHFEAVNCAGIPEKLFESELFGHARGAFSDAKTDKMGKWTMAHDGTLFLDEIGDLTLEHQAKILRALEDGKITPVGYIRPAKVNARVIAATNKNLPEMVKKRTFREDLLFRLRTFLIPSPALHQHPEDIPPISNYLWRKITSDSKAVLPKQVLDELCRRRWPGNAREIKAVLTCVHALVEKEGIDAKILRAVLDQQGNSLVP